MIMCLSPFTAITVHSISIPKIATFEFFIDDYYSGNKPSKRIHLSCKSNSRPASTIAFYKDGVELRSSSRIKSEGNGDLFIYNATHDKDDGVYRCTASNENGEISQEHVIKMTTVGEFVSGSRLSDPSEMLEVVIGRSKSIFCPDHTYSYPLEYKWATSYRGRYQFFSQSRRIHFISGGRNLFFSYITKEDVEAINKKGGISCVLKTDGNLKFSKKFKLRIEGQANIGDREPLIVEAMKAKQYVKEGDNLNLKCAATGNPIPSVKWFHNGVAVNINDSTRYEINTFLPERLTLRKVRADMEGEYKCEFENRAGKQSSRGNVLVARQPRINKQLPQITETVINKELLLQCVADGTNPIKYKWIRNGSQLTTYHSEKGSVTVTDGTLKIANVSFEDQGVYQCIVKSKYGQDFSVTKVIVKQPSAGITGNESTPNASKNSTKLNKDKSMEKPLELKYIILIACGGTIFLVIACGGIFMYCRTKKDNRQEQFIATPKPGYHDYHRQSDGPVYARPDFSTTSTSFHDSDDDVTSTFSGAKMNDPVFLNLMDKLREDKNTTPSENFYYDVEDSKHSMTPSTEL